MWAGLECLKNDIKIYECLRPATVAGEPSTPTAGMMANNNAVAGMGTMSVAGSGAGGQGLVGGRPNAAGQPISAGMENGGTPSGGRSTMGGDVNAGGLASGGLPLAVR